jgi:hypothetical protein
VKNNKVDLNVNITRAVTAIANNKAAGLDNASREWFKKDHNRDLVGSIIGKIFKEWLINLKSPA